MKPTDPKGILVPIGGSEDKKDNKEILIRILAATKKRNPKVCLITVATNLPKEVAKDYIDAFKAINHKRLSIVHFDVRSDAGSAGNIKHVTDCDLVLFSGGDQLKLSSLLGGTHLLEIIKTRYNNENNFVVAGTSAGAVAMSDTMILSGGSQDALIKGELALTNGLDFINSVFIDTHFTERGRFGRLIQAIAYNPGILGIGLGEDTAVIIRQGKKLEVIGSGLLVIADGTGISFTDLTEIEDGDPLTVEGIRMHVLGSGKHFLLAEKKLMKSDIKKSIKATNAK